jgi:hypothetical protein
MFITSHPDTLPTSDDAARALDLVRYITETADGVNGPYYVHHGATVFIEAYAPGEWGETGETVTVGHLVTSADDVVIGAVTETGETVTVGPHTGRAVTVRIYGRTMHGVSYGAGRAFQVIGD